MSTQSSLLCTDPDTQLSGSIILEGEVHKDAMPSGQFNPIPVPKSKEEEAECIQLTPEMCPSVPNGVAPNSVSVNVVFAGVQRRVRRLVGGAALRLKSALGSSGGGTIRVVSRSGTPVPGSSSSAAAAGSFDVQFQEGLAAHACGGGGSCSIKGAEEAAAVFERALGGLPTSAPWSGESAGATVDVRAVLEIVAGLALPGGDSDCEEDLEGAVEGGKSDTVLITVCNCLEVDDCMGYIEMRTVTADGERDERQDYDISHAGGGF